MITEAAKQTFTTTTNNNIMCTCITARALTSSDKIHRTEYKGKILYNDPKQQ